MDEPQTEFLRVIDPLTKGIILCVNHHHVASLQWRRNYLNHSFSSSSSHVIETKQEKKKEKEKDEDENDILFQKNIIDLIHDRPCTNKKSFNVFGSVDIGAEQPYVELLIDYACEMHHILSQEGEVVLHCTTGTYRTPIVLLSFFLLRGFSKLHARKF